MKLVAVRILVVDDDRAVRESLRRSLSFNGYSVALAEDGVEALEMIAADRPDGVVLDVMMPRLDGLEVCRQLRSTGDDLPILVLSMHTADDIVAGAIRAGATGYLVKDCSIGDIAAAVREAASGETHLSPAIAESMLAEVHRLDGSPPGATAVVSPREVEVLQLVADGCSTPEIAAQLFISQKTVKNHLASIYQKLDARDRTQAVLQAVRMGIVRLD